VVTQPLSPNPQPLSPIPLRVAANRQAARTADHIAAALYGAAGAGLDDLLGRARCILSGGLAIFFGDYVDN
jgi:hypothetical protein